MITRFKIFENVQQSKSLLNKLDINLDDSRYLELKKLLGKNLGYYINLNNITLIDEAGNERDFSYTVTDTNLVNLGIKNILTKYAAEKFMWYSMSENGGILKNIDMSIKIGSNSKIKPIRYDTNNENYEDILNQLNNQIGFVNKLAELKNDKKIQKLYYNSPIFSFNYNMKYDPKNLNNIFKKLNK
jgi:hypothetical protein